MRTRAVLRMILCQFLEGERLVSGYLRHFVRFYNDKMIDLTTLCTKRRVSVRSGLGGSLGSCLMVSENRQTRSKESSGNN